QGKTGAVPDPLGGPCQGGAPGAQGLRQGEKLPPGREADPGGGGRHPRAAGADAADRRGNRQEPPRRVPPHQGLHGGPDGAGFRLLRLSGRARATMSSSSQGKSFVDHLSSPLTLLPMAAGLSLLIIAWVIPTFRMQLIFLGLASFLAGIGILFTQWLFSREGAQLAGPRPGFPA